MVENFKCTDIFVLQYNVTTFSNIHKMSKFQFFHFHSPCRNAISSKVFNEFLKIFFWLKYEESGYYGMKIWIAHIFWFCHRNVTTFSNIQKMYKFQFFPLDSPSRNAISSKVFNEFSKTFFLAERWWRSGYCGWKFQVHRNFGFAIETLPLSQPPQYVKIKIFPFTRSQQKCFIFKSFLRIFKIIFLTWTMRKVAIVVENFKCHKIFWFCNSNATHFPTSREWKNFNFSFTLSQQKCYIFKSI